MTLVKIIVSQNKRHEFVKGLIKGKVDDRNERDLREGMEKD